MACDFLELAVPGVKRLSPYLPGKPIEELAREQGLDPENIVKLASNENPLGPSTSAVMAIAETMSELSRYPDGNGFALKQALSERLGVHQTQLTLGNGSNDLLVLIAEVFLNPQASAVYSEFAFVVYPLAVKATSAEAIQVPSFNWGHDLPAMAAAIKDNTRLVFLANPNNPTGTCFSKQAFIDFMAKVPEQVLVVLDEAYIEYNSGDNLLDGVALLKDYPNLIVSRTFSKAYGLAGARIGYTVSSPEIAEVVNRIRQPFNTSVPAQAAAVATLQDKEYLQNSVEVNSVGMDQLEQGLQELGLDWIPSSGNFITVDFKRSALPVYEGLLAEGVIVRPVANYGMPNHLRISIGLPEENQRCLDALEQVLEKQLERES
ncbi:histidinol-phosphate transaminase [Endozoicomonas sp. (ex Bugula neritina AB1)]|nr:histidinol-phosphate transaminase [Endozoicomonas sp. (ex Bugula neritina AB1)]